MRIRAAVLEEFGRPLVVQEVELAEPGAGEVLVGSSPAASATRISIRHPVPTRPGTRHACSATRAPGWSSASGRGSRSSSPAIT